MKRKKLISNNYNRNQKKLYLLLIGLALIAFIFGILFVFVISKDNKEFIKDNLINYYNNSNPSISLFFRTLFNYFIYIIVIWLLGISIIGIPIILFIYLFKMFIYGFSLSSIIYTFGTKGLLVSLIDLFPHKFIFLVIMLLLTFYSLSFAIKLIRYFFFKRPINFQSAMSKYLKILLISLSISIFITIYEVFISNYLINFFNI